MIQGMVYVFSEPMYQDIILPHMIQKLDLDGNKLDYKSSEVRLHVLLFARGFPSQARRDHRLIFKNLFSLLPQGGDGTTIVPL